MGVLLDKVEVGTGDLHQEDLRQRTKRRRRWAAVAGLIICVLSFVFIKTFVREVTTPHSLLRRLAGEMPWHDFVGEVPPELPRNAQWLTAQTPGSLASLRGKVVLIQFSALC